MHSLRVAQYSTTIIITHKWKGQMAGHYKPVEAQQVLTQIIY